MQNETVVSGFKDTPKLAKLLKFDQIVFRHFPKFPQDKKFELTHAQLHQIFPL
jgi:hypothetical protein